MTRASHCSSLCANRRYPLRQAAFMGDDLPDLSAMRHCRPECRTRQRTRLGWQTVSTCKHVIARRSVARFANSVRLAHRRSSDNAKSHPARVATRMTMRVFSRSWLLGLLAALASSWWLWVLQDKPAETRAAGSTPLRLPAATASRWCRLDKPKATKRSPRAVRSWLTPSHRRHADRQHSAHFTFPGRAKVQRWQANVQPMPGSARTGTSCDCCQEVLLDSVLPLPNSTSQHRDGSDLDVFPQSGTLRSDDAVTVRDAASILRGESDCAQISTRAASSYFPRSVPAMFLKPPPPDSSNFPEVRHLASTRARSHWLR
jgi:hypothetical protein